MRTRVNAIRRTSCALLCGITAGLLGGAVAVRAAEATPTAQADGRRVIVIESGEQVVVDADEGTAIAVDVSDEPTELINEGLIRAILDGAGPEGAAVGVCASTGDDRIVNRGSLISSTTIDQSLRLGGARANGDATGVSAGDGVDEVLNTGVLDVHAESVAGSGSLDVTTSGDSTINASSTAQATARGFDGGEGDDRLENDATMTVSASGTAGATTGWRTTRR